MEIKDRIERYRLARGMTVQAFEEKCGLSNGTWARPSNLREDSLIKIIEAFPDLDPAWLLRGDADMEQTVLENARNKDKDMKELLTLCRSLIKSQCQHDKLMKELASMIERIE